MKRLTAALLAAMLFSVCYAGIAFAENINISDAALGTVVQIRHNIDRHTSIIQTENGKLLKMSAEDIASADFGDYDTSDIAIGTDLCKVDGQAKTGNNIEDVINGSENKINTLKGRYNVHSLTALGGYPELFADSTILRGADGKRAQLMQVYPEEIPSYQVIKNKKNIYIENIDFYDFPMIKFEYCENIIFNNCSFHNFTDNGIVFRGCNDISVVNCTFVNSGSEITDCTNSGYSVRIVGGADCPSENILIENCTVNNSCGKAISFVGNVDNYVIRNNSINNSVWGAIDYWTPVVSGKYVNVIENNSCTNIGFGKPSENDLTAVSSGVGCAAIFAGMGTTLPKTVVKNNIVKNVVETGIEGPYELVYHNTIKNTGENSAVRYTGSTEAVFIKPAADFEQKYIGNDIETRGLRCFSSYSDSDEEYKGIYILSNTLKLKNADSSITCNYSRSDIEINCPKLKKLVIRDNKGMMMNKNSVNIYIRDKNYVMDYFDLGNPCMIGAVPENARYCFNINNN
ncbi:MAG: right-handed parallel beta-helix repeat-containing protein [Hominilimicola sp.]